MRLGTLLVVCGVALSGCDSNPAQPSPATCTYSLSPTSLSIGAAGGAGSVTVSTAGTCTWEGRSNVPWITAAGGPAVTGPGTFTFTVAAAPDSGTRAGTLTVASQTVTVTQQGQSCALTLLPPGRSFDALGGTAAFDVTAAPGCAWTSAATASWLTLVSGQAGTGNGTVTYAVAPNAEASSRTANLTVGGAVHAVTQSGLTGCAVSINPDDEMFVVGCGSGHFDVSAAPACAWLAASGAAWMRVTEPGGGLGTGSRRVSFAVDANPGTGTRTGTITVGAQTFVATQAGTSTCTYGVAPVDLRACETGGPLTVTVATAAGCGWTASASASWIPISSGQTGLGPGTITFTLPGNFNEARQDVVRVRWPAPTEGQNVRVAQEGCDYVLSPAYFTVPACGGDRAFDVYSGSTDVGFCGHEGPMSSGRCVWSAQSAAPWITVLTSMPRRGEDRVFFRVAANDRAPGPAAIREADDGSTAVPVSGVGSLHITTRADGEMRLAGHDVAGDAGIRASDASVGRADHREQPRRRHGGPHAHQRERRRDHLQKGGEGRHDAAVHGVGRRQDAPRDDQGCERRRAEDQQRRRLREAVVDRGGPALPRHGRGPAALANACSRRA
jgi:hypothetical protein